MLEGLLMPFARERALIVLIASRPSNPFERLATNKLLPWNSSVLQIVASLLAIDLGPTSMCHRMLMRLIVLVGELHNPCDGHVEAANAIVA